MGNLNTIASLLSLYGVNVPLIQRDYVQGRVHQVTPRTSDELKEKFKEEEDKRNRFVAQLIEALKSGTPKKLTFIYGVNSSNDRATSGEHRESFVPIDGQQRLTTLFLLCWIVKQIVPDVKISDDLMKGLKGFRYMTRPSSSYFCEALFSKTLKKYDCSLISERIIAQPWFYKDWLTDPSIQAMLQMLDEMQKQICRLCDDEKNRLAENLFDDSKEVITFELLDMDTYKLTDDLYVKMNARGKSLTPFEIFKADFIKHLNDNFGGDIFTDGQSFANYFEYRVEHQWTDLLWKGCEKEIEAFIEDENTGTEYPVIDNFFMNLFNAFSRVIYYKDNSEMTTDRVVRESVIKEKENVRQIFEFLDILYKIQKDGDLLWDELFYASDVDNFQKTDDRVRLFQTGSNVNLFEKAIEKDAKNMDVFILYALLKYLNKYKNVFKTEDLLMYLRSARNHLIEAAKLERHKEVRVDDDLRWTDSKAFIHHLDSLLLAGSSKVCIEEQIIQDASWSRGTRMSAFIKNNSTISLLDHVKALQEFTQADDVSKRKVLIANGFEGAPTNKNCNHGQCRFFGVADSANRWDYLFVSNKPEFYDAYKNYLVRFISGESLKDQIENTLKGQTRFDFTYYALKYDDYLGAKAFGKESIYYLSFDYNVPLNIMGLGNYSNSPLLAKHADPMIYTVVKQLVKLTEKNQKELYLAYSTKGSDPGDLWIYGKSCYEDKLYELHHAPESDGMLHDNTTLVVDAMPKDRVETTVDYILGLPEFQNVKFVEI